MAGTAGGQLLDHYLHTQYEVIRVVHDNLAAIQSVASHLTPVEDLVDFQDEISALYAKLGVLTTASELILGATPQGIAVLQAADAAAQRLLLELKSAALKEEEFFATATGLAAANLAIDALNAQMALVLADLATKATQVDLLALSNSVDVRFAATGADIDALEAQVADILTNLANGTYWAQLTVDVAALTTRVTTIEGQIAHVIDVNVEVDSRLTSLTDLVTGQGTAHDGLVSRVTANEDGAALLVGRVTELETGLVDLESGVAANTTAIQDLTTLTSMLNGVTISQGELITALNARIDNVENGNAATAIALQDLTTTVTQQGALLTTVSDFTTQLASRISDAETGLASNASALSGLSTEVTQLGDQLTIASEDITALRAEISSPGNLAPGAAFEADPIYGWTIFNRGAGWSTAQLARDLDAASELPLGMHALSVTLPTMPSGKLGIKSDNLPTRGGQRYILSGWLAAERCTATLEWRLLDQAGQIIQLGSIGDAKLDGGATDINLWPRLWGEIPANADARELQIQVWIQEVLDVAPKLWLLRPMLEEVSGLQDGPSAWVPGVAGLAKNTAEAVNTLTARIDGVEDDLTATASEVTGLGTQVGTMQSALIQEIITSSNKNASFSASINNLSSRMVDAEGELLAAAGAIDSLESSVTSLNGTVTSQGISLTSLQSQVNAIDADTGGAGAAISELNTRVTEAEGDIDSLSASVTALESSVTSANKIFVQPTAPPTAGRTVNDLWIDDDDGNKPYFFNGTTWVARSDAGKNKIFVQNTTPAATAINDLWIHTGEQNKPYRWNGTTWVDVSDGRTAANATAISSLQTRATAIEGVNTSQGSAITALENTVNNPTTGLTATAGALNTLTTRVSDAEGDINAQADALQTVTTTVNGHTSTINTHASSINGLKAQWSVTLDVNGYMSGLFSTNNGTKADFTILANNFWLVEPGAARRRLFGVTSAGVNMASDLYLAGGRIVIDTGTHMKVEGIGFGVGNEFISWFGVKMPITSCSRANAISYTTKNGEAYFGGSLTAGILRNSVASSSLVGIGNEVVNGPFNTNGNTKVVVVSYTRQLSRVRNAFGTSGYVAGSGSNTATVQIWRKIGTGADTLWATLNVTGSVEILNETDGADGAQLNWGGSITLNDSDPSVGDRTYRAVITGFTQQTVTHSGGGDTSTVTTARLTITSTEE